MPKNQQQKNKSAGTWAETQVTNFFKRWWPNAERRRLMGILDRGDIAGVFTKDGDRITVEVKNVKQIDLSAFLKELEVEMVNDEADHGVVIVRRRGITDPGKWYAVMTVNDWVSLIQGEQGEQNGSGNSPEIMD